MSKKLDTTAISNELRQGSVFFSRTPKVKKQGSKTSRNTNAQPNERTEIRSDNRTLPTLQKRRTKRYSFEFYEDQIVRLKQLKYKANEQGEQVFLSEFVREALDKYFKGLEE